MDKTIAISLGRDPREYRLEEAAYERLAVYLDRAGDRLHDDPDRAEVLGDLERSVGDRLAALPGATDRRITAADMDAVLEEVGAVDTGHTPAADQGAVPAPRRRLTRIREGEWVAGVCNGLAAYSEIDVGWVRTLFLFGIPLTGGILAVVYIALAFILPVTRTQET